MAIAAGSLCLGLAACGGGGDDEYSKADDGTSRHPTVDCTQTPDLCR